MFCNAFCWGNGFIGDDFPGTCFGFTTQNSSSEFITQTELFVMGRRGLIRGRCWLRKGRSQLQRYGICISALSRRTESVVFPSVLFRD
jgi:hypothetical protein